VREGKAELEWKTRRIGLGSRIAVKVKMWPVEAVRTRGDGVSSARKRAIML